MRAYERFLEYVKIHTTSDPNNTKEQPSTEQQWTLAKKLQGDMIALGIQNVQLSPYGYVYGEIPASQGCEKAVSLGLIAHMDTSPSASGKNVKPILHRNYNGEDVVLPNGQTIYTDVFTELKSMKGETLITASGDTLLGADDKAGIAEILTLCEEILRNNIPHGKIAIAFTPDEEIGRGTEHFDIENFGAKYAYTVDGSTVGEIEYETFNAASAIVKIEGVSVHPGDAKNSMINATTLAMTYDSFLPANERPEYTEGKQGFYHLDEMQSDVSGAILKYIIRDHDIQKFNTRKELMQQAAAQLQNQYPKAKIELTIKDEYYNMGQIIQKYPQLIDNAKKAIQMVGLTPITNPIRGGTDGAMLSFKGLPCPNLGTGGMYFHGINECITVERMDKAVEILKNLIYIFSEQQV